MTGTSDPKTVLHHYLEDSRNALLWKLDGVGERDARWPRTASGNNLLGLVKHCLNVEAAYFGVVFGRQFPSPHELVPMEVYAEDPQADWYARSDESKDGLVALYRRVAAFADETIAQLPLDAPGRVPWWQPGRQEVTLQHVLVHVLCDVARHAGHADVLREQIDGAVGSWPDGADVPDDQDWPAYVARLQALADGSERSQQAQAPGAAP